MERIWWGCRDVVSCWSQVRRLVEQLADSNISRLVEDELLHAGFAAEPPGGPERQPDIIEIFSLLGADHLPDQAHIGVAGAVEVGVVPGHAR